MADALVLDWRIVIAIAALLLAGISKTITGMGVPVAAVPVLTALYGDLSDVIVVTIVATTLSDIFFVVRGRRYARDALPLIPLLICGAVGIVIGAHVLLSVNDLLLAGALGIVLAVFVITSWFSLLPQLKLKTAHRLSPAVGLVAGALQGSTGASGPVVTMYLLSSPLTRGAFIFSINAVFQVLDLTQFITLQRLGAYDSELALIAALCCIPAGIGLVCGFWLAKRVNDAQFRKSVLAVLGVSCIVLLGRSAAGLW
jgi:uncharacterized membrane protein YfcA